jgi:maltooligosyltrehalose trehalohydrolase
VVFTQNHDQIGNRAVGERSSQLMSEGRLKVAAALLLTSPFSPLIFQGEEWGASTPFLYFTDHQDPDLGKAVSAGRRQEFSHFGWDPASIPDPQAEETFQRSRVDWRELLIHPHCDMLEWYRGLIALRKEPTIGPAGSVKVGFDDSRGTITLTRDGLRVLANIGTVAADFAVPPPGEILMASYPNAAVVDDVVRVSPDSVAIVTA